MVTDHFAFDTQRIKIHAWAEEAIEATTLNQSRNGLSVQLEIPLDSALPIRTKSGTQYQIATEADGSASKTTPRTTREPLRRDSLKRREALIKGKEGSRRRQRWENGSF